MVISPPWLIALAMIALGVTVLVLSGWKMVRRGRAGMGLGRERKEGRRGGGVEYGSADEGDGGV